ncbi:hypothetical protein [Reyranella sp.]|uniref:hypothetical protein n=1 Tax=Reyranella sp. TaxID=1929291 RepID=UPI002F925E56
MKTDRLADENRTPQPAAKKPYEAPVLKDWGTLQDMTLANGPIGKKDGGKGLVSRTR